MIRYFMTRAFMVGVALTLTGCVDLFGSSTPDQAPTLNATLLGTKQYEDDPSVGDSYAYPIALDGRTIGQGRLGWDDPIDVVPGWHTIRYGIARGTSYAGFGETQANLAAGKSYRIHTTKPIPYALNVLLSDGWIEDAAGVSISNRVPVKLDFSDENDGPPKSVAQP